MEIALKGKAPFPEDVERLLFSLYKAGFFKHGLMVGSWVLPLYREIFDLDYVLRTFDIDFAVETISPRHPHTVDLERVLADLGYLPILDYRTGLQKFTKGGFEIEFLVHRKGGREVGKVFLKHLNVTAIPLPFVDVLFHSPILADFGEYKVRVPCPEALFIHKLIVAQKRIRGIKTENDLAQCRTLCAGLDDAKLVEVMDSLKISKKNRNLIMASCQAIDFPPQRLRLK
jgi:hypothetical protein